MDRITLLGASTRHRPLGSALLGVICCMVLAAGCGDGAARGEPRVHVPDGEARLGRVLLRSYGCVDCHTIPGVRGANALVGPPLTHWSRRVYIAGLMPNTPENLVAWIHDPHRFRERSAMPNVGVSLEEATHMAAYLYTIR